MSAYNHEGVDAATAAFYSEQYRITTEEAEALCQRQMLHPTFEGYSTPLQVAELRHSREVSNVLMQGVFDYIHTYAQTVAYAQGERRTIEFDTPKIGHNTMAYTLLEPKQLTGKVHNLSVKVIAPELVPSMQSIASPHFNVSLKAVELGYAKRGEEYEWNEAHNAWLLIGGSATLGASKYGAVACVASLKSTFRMQSSAQPTLFQGFGLVFRRVPTGSVRALAQIGANEEHAVTHPPITIEIPFWS